MNAVDILAYGCLGGLTILGAAILAWATAAILATGREPGGPHE